MSVRATERLVGEVVVAGDLANSPKMVVQSVEIEAKLITTVWFSDDHKSQIGKFPASSLEKVEAPAVKKPAGTPAAGKAGPGRKPGKPRK